MFCEQTSNTKNSHFKDDFFILTHGDVWYFCFIDFCLPRNGETILFATVIATVLKQRTCVNEDFSCFYFTLYTLTLHSAKNNKPFSTNNPPSWKFLKHVSIFIYMIMGNTTEHLPIHICLVCFLSIFFPPLCRVKQQRQTFSEWLPPSGLGRQMDTLLMLWMINPRMQTSRSNKCQQTTQIYILWGRAY